MRDACSHTSERMSATASGPTPPRTYTKPSRSNAATSAADIWATCVAVSAGGPAISAASASSSDSRRKSPRSALYQRTVLRCVLRGRCDVCAEQRTMFGMVSQRFRRRPRPASPVSSVAFLFVGLGWGAKHSSITLREQVFCVSPSLLSSLSNPMTLLFVLFYRHLKMIDMVKVVVAVLLMPKILGCGGDYWAPLAIQTPPRASEVHKQHLLHSD
jgi:hypothetical protein